MPPRREFQTAAARRNHEPIDWTIDGQLIVLRDDLVVTDLGEFADVLTGAGQALGGQPVDEMEPATALRATQALVDSIVAQVEPLLTEESRTTWRRMGRRLDPNDLMAIVGDIVEAVTGRNPTSRSVSSEGSLPSGPSLTGTAPPAGWIPPPSPSTDA